MRDRELGVLLLRIAREHIGAELGAMREAAQVRSDAHPRLAAAGATFVTLTDDAALRGCIGSLEPVRPLHEDVARNATHAAFADPRFAPLRAHELERITIEVSLLSATTPMVFGSEEDLLAQLRRGEDGVVLKYGRRRGTFLPQVWEALPDPRDFMRELKGKAGLPADFWHAQLEVARYSVTKWTERDLIAPAIAAADDDRGASAATLCRAEAR